MYSLTIKINLLGSFWQKKKKILDSFLQKRAFLMYFLKIFPPFFGFNSAHIISYSSFLKKKN